MLLNFETLLSTLIFCWLLLLVAELSSPLPTHQAASSSCLIRLTFRLSILKSFSSVLVRARAASGHRCRCCCCCKFRLAPGAHYKWQREDIEQRERVREWAPLFFFSLSLSRFCWTSQASSSFFFFSFFCCCPWWWSDCSSSSDWALIAGTTAYCDCRRRRRCFPR